MLDSTTTTFLLVVFSICLTLYSNFQSPKEPSQYQQEDYIMTKKRIAEEQQALDDQVASLRGILLKFIFSLQPLGLHCLLEVTQNFLQLILQQQTMDEQRNRFEGNRYV